MADAAAAASTCSQLSTTSSSRRPASASATVSMSAASPCGVMPSAVAIAAGTDAASPTGASSTIHTPSGNSPASSAPTSSGQPGLADTADAAQRDQPVRPHELGDLGDQVLAADERAQLLRQVAREAVDAAEHRELEPAARRRRPGTPTSVPAGRGAGARPAAAAPRGLRSSTSVVSETSTWPPCASDISRAGAVHLAAEVVPVALGRLTGVQAHPDRERRRRRRRELLLRFDRRGRRVACRRERGAEAVADEWRTRSRRGARSRRARWRRAPAVRRPCRRELPPTIASSPRCR